MSVCILLFSWPSLRPDVQSVKENRSMKKKTFVALLGAEREHAPEKKRKESYRYDKEKPNRLQAL